MTETKISRVLVETALHVLVAWTGGSEPDSADVEILREAFPASSDLPIDDLACQVIHDLSAITFGAAKKEYAARPTSQQVA